MTTLRVTSFIQKPYFYENELGEFTGICRRILRQLEEDLGFEAVIDDYGSENYGAKLDNGTWTGLVGELYYNRSDMAVQTITVTEERSDVVDFTAPFMMSGIAAMMEANDRQWGKHGRVGQFAYSGQVSPTSKLRF